MNTSAWFSYQLKASEEGFVWAIKQVSADHQICSPPKGFGEWSVARHLFHMLYYERELALPHMRHWLGSSLPSFDAYNEDEGWEKEASSASIEHLLQEFQQTRAVQIALLSGFDEILWNEVRSSDWGEKSMRWIVSKTFQHTTDHTNAIMSMALFW